MITILKTKKKKSYVHHSWRSQDEKLHTRHPQAQLVMGSTFCILLQVYKWLYSTLGAFPLRLTLPMQNRVLQAKTGWWHINSWNEFLLDTGKMSGLLCTAITWTCGENEAEISRITWNLIYKKRPMLTVLLRTSPYVESKTVVDETSPPSCKRKEQHIQK